MRNIQPRIDGLATRDESWLREMNKDCLLLLRLQKMLFMVLAKVGSHCGMTVGVASYPDLIDFRSVCLGLVCSFQDHMVPSISHLP